jgi:hypothetical protein
MTTNNNNNNNNNNTENKNFNKQGYKGKSYKNFSNSNEQRNWEGEEPKVGCVLGLHSKWMDKKVSFEVFLEKTTDYVLGEFRNPRDIIGLIRELKDPSTNFRKNNLAKNLTAKQKESDIKAAIQAQSIKLYAAREADMKNNMDKVYGIVKGQCSMSLHTVIKQYPELDEKNDKHNVFRLLSKLKDVTSGLDMKSNKHSNLHEAILVLFTMKQGEFESDSNYMKRFEMNIKMLIIAGGKHILCSPE